MSIVLIKKGVKSTAALVPPTSERPAKALSPIINNPTVKLVSPSVPLISRDEMTDKLVASAKEVSVRGSVAVPTVPFPKSVSDFDPMRDVPANFISGRNLTVMPTSHVGTGTKADPIVFDASVSGWQYWINGKVDLAKYTSVTPEYAVNSCNLSYPRNETDSKKEVNKFLGAYTPTSGQARSSFFTMDNGDVFYVTWK